ncbi:MAG: GDP-mannose dehydrogenase [Nitrospira sp. SG-bin1]|nr:MAG: GDP-mannose dehydrogenase [Nitrospira sp. SG-bin1]
MKISIFGLGYVGCVSAACFAEKGHEVVGVDVNQLKADIVNQGRSPIVEPRVTDMIEKAVKDHRLRATTDAAEAVHASDISLICVGTPGHHNGSLDLSHIKGVCKQIGSALEGKSRYHVVAVRSTLLPGTIAETVIPTLEVFSGKTNGRDFGVAVNPEFLREGTSVHDFNNPPFTLIGADENNAAELLKKLYEHLPAPVITVRVKEAEMVKYACNCFHGLKVAFANEIGMICKGLGVDSHRVMEVFCKDTKLNLSTYYLKPGFAFGGSCLPKDLRAITYKARTLDIDVPMLSTILMSNRKHIDHAIDMILRTGKKEVGVLGLSFKPGTDDLRESPMVTLIEALIGKGLNLNIYDKEVELARIFGANKEYIEREIPHISSLMHSDLAQIVERSQVIVITKRSDEFQKLKRQTLNNKLVFDLVRVFDGQELPENYQGLCW